MAAVLSLFLALAPDAGSGFPLALPPAPRRVEIGRIGLEAAGLRIEAGDVRLERSGAGFRFAAGGLRMLGGGGRPLAGPLGLSGELDARGGRAALAANGTALLRLDLLRTADGFQLFFDTGRLRLGPDGLRAEGLVPALVRTGIGLRGEVELYGQIARLGDRRVEVAELVLEGVDLAVGPLTVTGLAGVIDFDRLLPPATLPRQELRAARLDVGLPLESARLRFTLDPDARLRLHGGEARLAGGRLVLAPAELAGLPPSGTLGLGVADVDLAPLVALLGGPEVEATGRIAGEGRLRLEASVPVHLEARLAATGPGVLRWHGALPEETAPDLRLALSVLRDFRYDALEATLRGDPAGELELAVLLRGTSPEAYGERPIELRMRFSGPLGRVLAGGALAAGLVRDLERALEEGVRGAPAAPAPPASRLPAHGAGGAAP